MMARVAAAQRIDISGCADRTLHPSRLAPRSGLRRVIGTLVGAMVTVAVLAGVSPAAAETRTLDLYNAHTKERLTITFKKNGRYIPSALSELNRFLRDWRRNEAINMDPRLFDTVWQLYTESGSRQPIHVVCGYRSRATNNMLRSRSKGVAENSQHTLGKAMDMFIPDVSVSKLRAIGVKMQNGGVGYYPSANSPFVHIDVGSVRTWPRMSRSQLLALFPDGKTAHLPSDGKPLPGYQQALAELKKNGRATRSVSVASAGAASTGSAKKGSLLAMLFGDEEDEGEEIAAGTMSTKGQSLTAPAKAAAPNAKAVSTKTVLPGVGVTEEPAPVAPPKAAAPVVVVDAPIPKPAPDAPVTTMAEATLPAVAEEAPATVALAEPPPAPRAKPEELVALAAVDAEMIIPRARPEIEEQVDLADATPVVTPDAAIEATPAPATAQLALAEVANDPSLPPEVAALGYAPAAAEEPAALRPAAPPLRTARLAPPAAVGAATGQGDPLSPLVGGKSDSLAALTAVPAPADLPIYDAASSAWWGTFARLAHPDQNDAVSLLNEPVTVIRARFSTAVYADLTASRFTGAALPRLQVMSFQPRRDLAMR